MRVLNLVTNPEARFFKQQVRVLAERGVTAETLAVPGHHPDRSRSPTEYLRYLPEVFGEPVESYDLVHANYGLTAPYALAKAGLEARVPWRDGRLPVVVSLWGSDLFGRLGPLTRRCAERADAVVVMSERMAAALGRPCQVIPHGVDLDRFRPADHEAAREAVGWRPDARHVLFPYPPDQPVKNYPVAERVVERAAADLDRPVELHAVTGVPHDEMPQYVNAADALLLPSDHEGSPNAVKEALACNLPVVATDVGDVRERLAGVSRSAVCDGEAAMVDALVDVLAAGERSDGRDAARAVSVERTGDRLAALYEDVLATGDRATPSRADGPDR